MHPIEMQITGTLFPSSNLFLLGVPRYLIGTCLTWIVMQIACQILCVSVNHGYDRYFGNGLVMGYADCKYLAGLVETSKVVSIVNLGLCQTHCKQVPDFSRLCGSDLITWASFCQPQSPLHFLEVRTGSRRQTRPP